MEAPAIPCTPPRGPICHTGRYTRRRPPALALPVPAQRFCSAHAAEPALPKKVLLSLPRSTAVPGKGIRCSARVLPHTPETVVAPAKGATASSSAANGPGTTSDKGAGRATEKFGLLARFTQAGARGVRRVVERVAQTLQTKSLGSSSSERDNAAEAKPRARELLGHPMTVPTTSTGGSETLTGKGTA
eukprot:RCo045459